MKAVLVFSLLLTVSIAASAQDPVKVSSSGQSAASNAASPTSRHEEQQVVKVQDALIDAYLHHDYAVLDRVLADDYTYIDDDGFVLTKQQMVEAFKSDDDRITSYKRQDEKVSVFGDTAIMTYRYQTEETYKGHEVGGDLRTTRIFAKRNGHWVMVGGQDTKVNPQPDFTTFSSNDELTLKQLEQDELDAYREGDAEKMDKILGDDFVGRWADGSTSDKRRTVEPIRTGEEKHFANQLVECNVRIYGDTAVVTGINTEQSILEGRDGSGTISFTDVFVKRHGRWQLVASETKRVAVAQKQQTTQQSVPSSTPDQADMTKQMVELSKPGENHKLVAGLAGTWEFTGKHFSDDPNEKPIEVKGSCVRKSLWEGRYFLTETTGEKLQMPWSDGKQVAYKDIVIDGYDNVRMKFVRAMIDNHWDTGILSFEGSYDAATKTITYEAELEDSPGLKTKTRWFLKILDHDHYTEEIYEDNDGRQVKDTEIHYRRVKGS
jgi:ketosteroid isomerase-like protein